jgi:hypothetical protein
MRGILALASAGLVTLAAASAEAQSSPALADIARRTAATRAAAPPAARVYSNTDLTPDPRSPQQPESPPAAGAPTGSVSRSSGESSTAEPIVTDSEQDLAGDRTHMDEGYWRREAAGVRSQLDTAQERVDVLATAPTPRTVAMQRIAERELVRARKVLADLAQRWARLKESAHDADVPTAWIEP